MVYYRKLTEIIVVVCENLEILFLALMTAMVFGLVVSRYVFSYSFAWVEELTRYLMIWAAYLGAAALFKDDDHIRMGWFYQKIPEKGRTILDLVMGMLQMAFLVALIILGFQYSESVSLFVAVTLNNLSMFWVTLIIPISAILMVILIIFNLINTAMRLAGKKMPTDQNQPEGRI